MDESMRRKAGRRDLAEGLAEPTRSKPGGRALTDALRSASSTAGAHPCSRRLPPRRERGDEGLSASADAERMAREHRFAPCLLAPAADRDQPAVQLRSSETGRMDDPAVTRAHAAHGISGPAQPLPHLDAIQRSFGPSHDLSQVQAHVGGDAAEAAGAIGADAYAIGNHVAFAGTPRLHTAAHEAAHVVQQRAGVQLLGGVGEVGDAYEQHADAVAERVTRGESAEALLDSGPRGGATGDAVQRQAETRAPDVDGTIARNSRALGLPLPPVVVDHMMRGTEAIREFVVRHMAHGTQADGKTFFYRTRAAMAEGLVPHIARFGGVDAKGAPQSKTDADIRAEAKQTADTAVAVTMTPSDNTIHINIGDGDHMFRTILHEAVHAHTRTHADGLGFGLNEGVAEYISEMVLDNYGVPFKVYGPYRKDYEFVRYLARALGKDIVMQFAMESGRNVLKAEFDRYGAEPGKCWAKWENAVRTGDYPYARKILEEQVLPLRGQLRADDERAEQANDAFWREADDLESDLTRAYERSTWRSESAQPIETVVTSVTAAGNWTALGVPRGGRHGVREGWLMAFGPETELFPAEYLVSEVKNTSAKAIVPRPSDELAPLATHRVTLRKP